MDDGLINLAGWLPALFLPGATLAQLWKIARTRHTEGVSILTWLLFGFANLGIYIFTEKYGALQSILAQLLTAVLNFTIVGWILVLRSRSRAS
jgi:uncharacterized protein with PQ loop repeat